MSNGHTEIYNHLQEEQTAASDVTSAINIDRLLVQNAKNDRVHVNDDQLVIDMAAIVVSHNARGCTDDPCPVDDWADQLVADVVEEEIEEVE